MIGGVLEMNGMQKLYTVKEVSEILRTNTTYVYGLIKSGLLPNIIIGTKKIPHDALSRFLEYCVGKDVTDPYNVITIESDDETETTS